MSRLKTFLLYALAIIGFYFFSNVLMFFSIKGTYENLKGQIMTKTPHIEISEAKATYVNGYIDGSVTNNTEEKIENKYIKIDIFSERDVKLGTKYVEIESLGIKQTQEFHMGYRLKDSYRFEISYADTAEGATEEQFASEELRLTWFLGNLIILSLV